jgi:hypothetical protein
MLISFLRIMALIATLTFPLYAEVERIAIVVGVNQGLPSERPLKYASRDAQELATLLRRSGTFDKDRVYLLTDATLEKVKGVMDEVAGRIKEIKKSNNQTLVVFYFSGHGGAEALHIKGKAFPRTDIVSWFNRIGGDIRIMILDACESGDFLRRKGAIVLDEDPITISDSLRSKGSIILSASSRGEMAQESEEYKGAVFTHHLLNGLQGVADYNGDKVITLMEAFDYARASTRMEKIGGREAAQNPSFDLDLVGENDPILARLGGGRNRLLLAGLPAGQLDICEAGDYSTVNHILLTGRDSLYFVLPAAKYLLGFSHDDSKMVGSADLTWSGDVTVSLKDFRRRPKGAYTEKGERAWTWNPHGIDLSYSRANFAGRLSLPLIKLNYTHHGYNWIQGISLSYGSGSAHDSGFENSVRLMRFALETKLPLATMRFGRLNVGGVAAWSHAWQELSDKRFPLGPIQTGEGDMPLVSRSQANIFQGMFPLEVQGFLPGGFRISLGNSFLINLFHEKNLSELRTSFGMEPYLGLGFGI